MKIKEYFSLLLNTLMFPTRAFEQVLAKKTVFHVIYYMSFTCLLGAIMALTIAFNPEEYMASGITEDNLIQMVSIPLITMPFFFFIFALYFDFAQSVMFKIKNMTLNYFKTVLWSFHFFVIMMFLSAPVAVMASKIYIDLGFAFLLMPFFYFAFLLFWGLKVSATKTAFKTIATFVIGGLVFYIPFYLLY